MRARTPQPCARKHPPACAKKLRPNAKLRAGKGKTIIPAQCENEGVCCKNVYAKCAKVNKNLN